MLCLEHRPARLPRQPQVTESQSKTCSLAPDRRDERHRLPADLLIQQQGPFSASFTESGSAASCVTTIDCNTVPTVSGCEPLVCTFTPNTLVFFRTPGRPPRRSIHPRARLR